jgi:hypothetical protein
MLRLSCALTHSLGQGEFIREQVREVRETKKVALSMEGGGRPEGPRVDIDEASIDAKDLRVAQLEELTEHQSFELTWRPVSLPEQMMGMRYSEFKTVLCLPTAKKMGRITTHLLTDMTSASKKMLMITTL